MEKRHREILRKARAKFVSELKVADILHRFPEPIFTELDEEEIKVVRNRHQQTETFLDILPKRGPIAYYAFKEALRSPYPHLFDVLEDEEDEKERRKTQAQGEKLQAIRKILEDDGNELPETRRMDEQQGIAAGEIALPDNANNQQQISPRGQVLHEASSRTAELDSENKVSKPSVEECFEKVYQSMESVKSLLEKFEADSERPRKKDTKTNQKPGTLPKISEVEYSKEITRESWILENEFDGERISTAKTMRDLRAELQEKTEENKKLFEERKDQQLEQMARITEDLNQERGNSAWLALECQDLKAKLEKEKEESKKNVDERDELRKQLEEKGKTRKTTELIKSRPAESEYRRTVKTLGVHSLRRAESRRAASAQRLSDEEEEHLVEEEANKIIVYEGTLTSEGTHLDLKLGAVHLTSPPGAVSEPTSIVVHKWKSSACSPQLQEHEAIVSNVIEISTINNEALQFKVGVKLVFSHCAPNLQGYEVVIKRLINKEINDWEEVEGTVDARQLSDIEDEYPNEVPDFSFPVVQADIAECSIFTVICRLIPSPTFTISSRGGCFHHPDYPGVAVTVPKKAVSVKSKCPLQLKVQEVPNDEFEGRNVYVGPILRISCTQGIEFLKPVTIQLPVAPRVEEGAIPDPSICRVRVLFLRSDGESKEWVEITDDLENPVRFDGTSVTFQVKRFSGYGYVVSWNNHRHGRYVGIVQFLYNILWTQPRLAYFFAYFRLSECPISEHILYLICCPAHVRDRVEYELEKEGIRSHEAASSRKRMIPGRDKAFVSVSGGISPVNEEDMTNVCLMLEADEQSKDILLIDLISDQRYGFVEFRSTRGPAQENNLAKLPLTLPTLNVLHQPQGETTPGLRVKEGQPTDEELEMLASEIGEHWISLGRRLKFGESPLIGFAKDKSKYSEKAYEMLLRWKQRGGTSNATYQILAEALCHKLVGRTDLAEKYCSL